MLVPVRAVGDPAPVRACAVGAGELALAHHPGVPLVALRAEALAGEVDATEAGFLFEKVGNVIIITRTDSVQKVCGGVWQGVDNLTKL